MFPRLFGIVGTEETYEALLDVIASWHPDLVLTEPADLAAPIAARTAGVVHVTPDTLRTVARAVSRRTDLVVVVTAGPGADTASLGSQPAHIRVAEYIPQERLLGRASLVVSHAGSGTLLGALATACRRSASRAPPTSSATPGRPAPPAQQPPCFPTDCQAESVTAANDRALADPTIAANARRVASEIPAMPTPGEVVAAVESLVTGWSSAEAWTSPTPATS